MSPYEPGAKKFHYFTASAFETQTVQTHAPSLGTHGCDGSQSLGGQSRGCGCLEKEGVESSRWEDLRWTLKAEGLCHVWGQSYHKKLIPFPQCDCDGAFPPHLTRLPPLQTPSVKTHCTSLAWFSYHLNPDLFQGQTIHSAQETWCSKNIMYTQNVFLLR